MLKNNKGNVLIYSLVLVNLALLLALAMFNNFFVFLSNTESWNIDKKLSNNILEKWALYAKYAKTLNSNGNGIVDDIGCPTQVTMSGDTVLSTTSSSLVYLDWIMYCSWTHNASNYYIYFNQDFDAFSGAIYVLDPVNLIWWIGERDFIDSDNTRMDISLSPTPPDGVDDDFNSDNYRVSWSGVVMFPWWYIDDDIIARTSIYGYISPQSEYSNILWANDKVHEYINLNPNNSDSVHDTLGNVSAWVMHLDADRNFDLKILQLDKAQYNDTKEIIVESKLETTWISAWIWYIQNNTGTLSLSGNLTGNEYIFDFTTNDYAIFLDNIDTGVLTYILELENASGSGVYINSIDDSGASSIKFLGSEIIQDAEKNYIWKIFEVTNKK